VAANVVALLHPPAEIGGNTEHEPDDDLARKRQIRARRTCRFALLAPEVVVDLIASLLPDFRRESACIDDDPSAD
jgi:hypothetical protein